MNPNNSASTEPHLLAISGLQRMMLHTALDAQTALAFDQIMTVKLAFRITPGASARNLRHAFNKLVARHDSLRLRFVQNGGDWKAEILPEHPTGLILQDLSDLPQEAQMAQIIEQGTRPMTALSDPLFEMHLIKCGPAGDVVLTRACHSIVDGYGIALLIEDLLKFVLNMPVPKAAVTHEEFITIQQQEIQKNGATAFWLDHLIPPPKDPNIGLMAKGLPPASARNNSPTYTSDDLLNPAQSKRLDALTKKTGISAFCYIHAAFSETLCDLADQDEVIIQSFLGRQDPRLAHFIGAEMQEILLRFKRHPVDIHESARQVQRNISDAARHVPTDIFFTMGNQIAREVAHPETYNARFIVHTHVPSGKISASPFEKLFSKAMNGKLSMGFVNLENIPLETTLGTAELFLSVSNASKAPNATLDARTDAFSLDEVKDIMARTRAKLNLEKAP